MFQKDDGGQKTSACYDAALLEQSLRGGEESAAESRQGNRVHYGEDDVAANWAPR